MDMINQVNSAIELTFNREDEIGFAECELHGIVNKDDINLYIDYINSGCNINDYKINPLYKENDGIDAEKVFSNGALRWKRAVSEIWFYSLNLNHLLASFIDDYGEKDGEKEFYDTAKNSTGLSKKKITDIMRMSQVLTLKQAVELQTAGCQITGVMRLAAPETPKAAVEMALAEAQESGTVLTTEVVADIIDFSKNGIVSEFEPEIETPSDDDELEVNTVDVELLSNGKNRYSVMAGDEHLGAVEKVDNGVWRIDGSNGEPAFKSEQDAAKRLAELSQDKVQNIVVDVIPNIDNGNDELKEKIKQLKIERENLLAQLEQLKNEPKPEPEKQEIKIPEGAILIDKSQAEVFKQWVKYWGHKHGADTPRGAGIVTALNELKGIISDISDVEIPQCKAAKKAK